MLPGLGSRPQQEVWNEKLGIYEYVAGDNSLLILLYGIATIFIIIAYIIVAASAVKSSFKLELLKEKGKHINTFAEDVKSLFNENHHKLLLTLPVSGVLIFTILPLIFMISMAFTNYSKVDSHLLRSASKTWKHRKAVNSIHNHKAYKGCFYSYIHNSLYNLLSYKITKSWNQNA